MTRHRSLIVYLVACLIAVGSTLRYMGYFVSHPSRWVIFGLLAAFYALLAVVPRLPRRSQLNVHLYLALQTSILVALAFVTTIEDVMALPFLALILLAMTALPPRIGFLWIGVFTVLMVGSMIVYGIMFHGMDAGMILLTAVVYVTGYLGFGTFMAVLRQLGVAHSEAQVARRKSEQLLAELQVAHQQLQAYAEQAEELAVVSERNRLARDLHDSVTQSLYAVTLYADAVERLLSSGQVDLAAGNVRKLRRTARDALGEMRLLIYELRPPILEQEGLVVALESRLKAVEARSGLEVQLDLEEQMTLPPDVQGGLYRIAQEALNNTLKHARAHTVTVSLRPAEGKTVVLEITDDGVGFDPAAARERGGAGLRGMAERVEQLGGQLGIESEPGVGTVVRVQVEVDL